jgi:cell division septation protein DedD
MAKAARPGLRFWDRVVLLGSWIVTCGLVYLLGFYVGKGMQDRRLGVEERVVRLPVTSTPPPGGQRPKASSELTFYETLVSGSRAGEGSDSGGAKPQPPPAVAEAPPPTLPEVHPPVPKSVVAVPPAAPKGPVVVAKPPEPTATLPPRPSPPPTTVERAPAAPPRSGTGNWTVEANPTRDRNEAEFLLGRLKSRGYDASLVHVQREGDTWYRLRVGRYTSAEQAGEVMRRLRDQEGVPHAFVASE